MTLVGRTLVGTQSHFALLKSDHYALLAGTPWDGLEPSGEEVPNSTGSALTPVTPGKIIGVGKNYKDHAKEMGGAVPAAPLLFLKPSSSLSPSGASIDLPVISKHVDFEAELGVVIGKRAKNVSSGAALDYVFGYVAVCDLTARDLQKSDGQWARAKGCDGFCPIGPAIETDVSHPQALQVKLWLNGKLKQDGNTADMVFDVPTLIAHISQAMTLEPGDIIATGTPSGVGPLSPGDKVIVEVGSLPRLLFQVNQ